jgi:ribose transport system substrate-binding protein
MQMDKAHTSPGRSPMALGAAAAALLTAGLAVCTPVRAADPASPAQIIAAAGKTTDTSFCGKKPIVLGIDDGVGTNGWSHASMAAVRSEAAKCPNVKQVVQIGEGDLQKTISDVNGMVAQGIDALVLIPDFGKAELPAIRNATRAGVKVVAWGADPGGKPGRDYVAYVDWDVRATGIVLAQWMVKALHGEGNVVFLGGPAGNPVSAATLQGIVEVLSTHPKMHLLTGTRNWAVTDWDSAVTQKTMTALLGKYPSIKGIIDDSGGFDALGVLRTYQTADRPLVPLAVLSNNQLACDYAKLKPKNPGFELGTISARNWVGRIAARKAIAAAEGQPNDEPDIYRVPLFEDTLGGTPPRCDPAQQPDMDLSVQLTPQELSTYGKSE